MKREKPDDLLRPTEAVNIGRSVGVVAGVAVFMRAVMNAESDEDFARLMTEGERRNSTASAEAMTHAAGKPLT